MGMTHDEETQATPLIELLVDVAAVDLEAGVDVPAAQLTDDDLLEYHREVEVIVRSRRSPLDQTSTLLVR